jgi:hypothetical protein
MFYYVIYNSTVLNYSNKNKKLNTFIYGTVLYILSHGLINSYDNQFAQYIKSYFWIVLAIDIFAIYYLHNFIDPEQETETNLKDIIKSFYNNDQKLKTENNNNNNNDIDSETFNNLPEDIDNNQDHLENKENHDNNKNPIPYFPDELDINENIDQMSDAGSDIDLDKFEMSLQN